MPDLPHEDKSSRLTGATLLRGHNLDCLNLRRKGFALLAPERSEIILNLSSGESFLGKKETSFDESFLHISFRFREKNPFFLFVFLVPILNPKLTINRR